MPEEEDISVAAPLDSARSGGAPAGSRSARDDSVAEVSLAGHAEDEGEDVSIGADYAEPVRPQTRKWTDKYNVTHCNANLVIFDSFDRPFQNQYFLPRDGFLNHQAHRH